MEIVCPSPSDQCVSSVSAVCVAALEVTVAQNSIQVARGQTAVLHCSFTTSAALNNLNIIWMVIPLSNANLPEQSLWQTFASSQTPD
uniref:Immunoglobulin V-set domain-containing protein n=1 Tax=Knipowitschia caucasica TaxID=637954 RepID=A0AAV2IZU9_KNICA